MLDARSAMTLVRMRASRPKYAVNVVAGVCAGVAAVVRRAAPVQQNDLQQAEHVMIGQIQTAKSAASIVLRSV